MNSNAIKWTNVSELSHLLEYNTTAVNNNDYKIYLSAGGRNCKVNKVDQFHQFFIQFLENEGCEFIKLEH